MYSCPQQLNSCHIKKLCKDLNIVKSGRQLINFYGKLLLLDSASLEGSKINLEYKVQCTLWKSILSCHIQQVFKGFHF